MNKSSKNIILLIVGLAFFALFGTGVFYAADLGKPARPNLIGEFNFYKGLSADSLNFSDNEIRKLNKSFKQHRKVVKKAVLTVADTIQDQHSKDKNNSKLEFDITLHCTNGMVFTPPVTTCSRKKLVSEIVTKIDRGAKIINYYSTQPHLKNKNITIVDM
ncbi:hypothetical protein [Maridesulfovibrio zosterae]|uniref:hypothetical protein n=1 Tax=Maridesulfovibrio zosterae TaxID=82171 RepID=UPI0004062B77|nr:hypothetical protein [Maridesulfovibrio zosterae]